MSKIYEWLMSKSFKQKDDSIVFEIGCHNGSDTVNLNKIFTNSKFYCYEPDPDVYKKCLNNLNYNYDVFFNNSFFVNVIQNNTIEVFNVGISDGVRPMVFYKSSGTYCGVKNWDYSGSLIKPKNHTKIYPEIKFNDEIYVDTFCLDRICEYKDIDTEVSFVWADVQGAELQMIRGGSFRFFKNVRYLYTEFDQNEMYEGESTKENILNSLPNYEIVFIDGENLLLKNTMFKD